MEKKMAPKTLSPADIHVMERVRLDYRVFVEADVTLEDIKRPEFWTHVVRSHLDQKGSILPLIEVVWKDRSKVVDLYVASCAESAALVVIKSITDIHNGDRVVNIDNQEYEIKWSGPKTKWRVYRKSDGELLGSGLEKPDAEKFLDEYIAKITKAA